MKDRAHADSKQAQSVSTAVACGAYRHGRGGGGAPGAGRPTPHQTPRQGTPAGRRPGRARWARPPRACPPPSPPARRGRARRLRGVQQERRVTTPAPRDTPGLRASLETRAPHRTDAPCVAAPRAQRPAAAGVCCHTPARASCLPALPKALNAHPPHHASVRLRFWPPPLSVQLRQALSATYSRPLEAAHRGRTRSYPGYARLYGTGFHAARRRGGARPRAAVRVPARALPCAPACPRPGGPPRLHAAGRVLDDQAVGRRGAQLGRGRAEAVRRRLAVPHLVAAVRHLRAARAAAGSRRGPGAPLSVSAPASCTEAT